MPLRESEAIILQSYPLGEADRIVSFLSRSMGRVRGVAAGARRTKSRFGSTLERLSHVRIWIYERETRDLVRISQCELIESFLDAYRDYACGLALALFAEITEAVLPERDASDANFRLLLLVAQAVKRTGKPELAMAYFALWTVKLGGWLPALDRCARCGHEFSGERGGEPAYFSRSASAVVCGKCRKPGMRVISPVALAAAHKMLAGHPRPVDRGNDSRARGERPDRCYARRDREPDRPQARFAGITGVAYLKKPSNNRSSRESARKPRGLTFQNLLLKLEQFWADRDCILQQPYDVEVGAGTMHPETFLRVLGPEPYRVVYAQLPK